MDSEHSEEPGGWRPEWPTSISAGARELALDTAENADDLIAICTKRGYRFIETVDWGGANYRSVIMSKKL